MIALALVISVMLGLSLVLPEDADARHKRPKRRNSVAQIRNDLEPLPASAFTCVWSEEPLHDYACDAPDTEPFGLFVAINERRFLTAGDVYPHERDVDGYGGEFPLASPDIAPQFGCRFTGPGESTTNEHEWRCSFTYNAHEHDFLVSEIVSVAYTAGLNSNDQFLVPCDRDAPCPEVDPPPDTQVTSGPGPAVRRTSATLAFSSSEAGSTFQCRLGSAEFAPCTTPLKLTGLPEGRHVFRVRAIDDRGKLDDTPAVHRWRVDRTSPRLRISRRATPMTPSGVVKVRVRCRRPEPSGPCAGRLRLATAAGKRIGAKRFSVATGKPKRLRIVLRAPGRALVIARGRVRVMATARTHDAAGNTATTRRRVTLFRR
jgi:hypothetical protein